MQQLTTPYHGPRLSVGTRVSMPRFLSKKEKFRLWLTKTFARVMHIPIEIDEGWMRTTAFITSIAADSSYELGTEEPLIPENPGPQKPETIRVCIGLYWDNKLKRYSTQNLTSTGKNPALEIATDLPILDVDQPETKYWYAELEPNKEYGV